MSVLLHQIAVNLRLSLHLIINSKTSIDIIWEINSDLVSRVYYLLLLIIEITYPLPIF